MADLPTPALVRDGTPCADGDRAAFEVERPGFSARISMPRRPRAWLVVAAPAEELADLESTDLATVRVAPPERGDWRAALGAAATWLASLPEARGLPIAFAGAGEEGRAAATTAAAASSASALVLDAEHRSEVALVPTVVGADGPGIERFLETELGLAPHGGALNHGQRRFLARRLERGLRREQRRRGGLTASVRAGLAVVASALALTLSLGASPASANVEADYNNTTGELSFVSDGAADTLIIACSLDGNGVGGDVVFSENGGANQTLPPTSTLDGQLECPSVATMTVEGAGGGDVLDASVVDTVTDQYENLVSSEDVTMSGGNGADSIDGPDGTTDASLAGGDGDDTIIGGDGDDSLFGGALDDSLAGLNGNDTVSFSASSAGVNADLGGTATGQGTDTLSVENAIGSAQGDTIVASSGPSSILGGGGADELTGTISTDTLLGEAGGDTLDGASNPDSLDGGTEGDSLAGGTGTSGDTLDGDAGSDVLDGASGADSVAGGTEDDTLLSSDTLNDSLNGEAGLDMADYSGAAGPVTINMNASPDTVVGSGTDTLTSIEGATGSPAADSITGGVEANTFDGDGAGDTISALAGNDSLIGDLGADSVSAGTNNDTVAGDAGNDTLNADGGLGSMESLDGGTQNDSLVAGTATAGTTLIGNSGLDTLTGSDNVDSMAGGGDADLMDLGSGNDTGSGDAGNDTLEGNGGATDDDSLVGGTENDSIEGASGADTLSGLANDDTLWGSSGDDVISAGGGAQDELFEDATDPVLSNTLLTGDGTDTLDGGFERASLSGFGDFDASDFSGSVTLNSGTSGALYEGAAGSDSILAADATDTVAQTVDGDQAINDTLLTGDGTDTVPFTFRLSLTGDTGADEIDASGYGFGLTVTMDGLGGDDTLIGAFGSDTVTGGTGTDRLVEDRSVNTTLTDTLLSGTSENDTLADIEQASVSGDNGSNDIDAGAFSGSVTLDGGTGSDTLTPAAGSDLIDGNDPLTDVVAQSTDAEAQTLTNTQLTGTGTDTLAGIESASLEGGTSANDLDASGFTAGAGNVTLAGQGGADELTGVPTKFELLDGGTGADTVALSANTGHILNDTLWGASEIGFAQTTLADVDAASLTGGAAANNINASAFTRGPVSLSGLAGNDSMSGTAASDSLVGGADADQIAQTADASQTLTNSQVTGRGTDSLGTVELAALTGGPSPNDLDASAFAGAVTLEGQDGNDTLASAPGADRLDGGTDVDRLEHTSNSATQSLTNALLTDGALVDSLIGGGIEHVSMTGGAAANDFDASDFDVAGGSVTMRGAAGDDTLEASDDLTTHLAEVADRDMTLTDDSLTVDTEGTDSLEGTFDGASLTGGAGANVLSAAGYDESDTTLAGDAGNDTLAGGVGIDDSLVGGPGTNAADYSANPAGINADLGAGTVLNASTDSLSGIQNVTGTAQADTITGDGANNTLLGGASADVITGGGGADSLGGEAGGDTLNSDDGGTADTANCGGDGGNVANADSADTIVGCETQNISQPPPEPPPPDPGGGGGGGGGGSDPGGGGGGGGGGPAPDTRAPGLDVGGDGKQKNKKKVKVEVACDEACTVDGEGTIKVPEKYDKKGKVSKKKKFDLKAAEEVELGAGEDAKLKLEFKNKAANLVKKAFKEKEKSTAKVTATAIDAAGNETVADKFEIKVKK